MLNITMRLKVIPLTKWNVKQLRKNKLRTRYNYHEKRCKRKSSPKMLPREVIEFDIDANEKQCSYSDHTLHKIGEERSEKLAL